MTTEIDRAGAAGIWVTFRESPPAVKALLAGAVINRLGSLLNIFLVLFLTAEGYSARQATFALGVYGAGTVLGVLIGGVLADRLGARNATVISMTGSGVLLAALLYLPTYSLLLVTAGLVGLVAQIYRPASSTMLAELTPKSRLLMTMAMYRFGLNVGTTAAPLVGFALYSLNGNSYSLLFWADAILAFVYAGVAVVVLPARTQGSARPAGGHERAGYAAVLRDRRYLLFLIATLLNAAVYVQYTSTLPLDIAAQGIAIFWYSAAVSLNGIMVIAFEMPFTKISQRWPLRVSVGLAFGLVGVGIAVYGLPLGPAVIIIGTLLWTTAEIVGGPAVFSYPAVAGPAHLKSRYIGGFQFAHGLGTALGPMLGGLVFARIGHGVWPVMALIAGAAAVLGIAAIRAAPASGASATSVAPAGPVLPATDPAGVTDEAASPVSGQQPHAAPGRRGADSA